MFNKKKNQWYRSLLLSDHEQEDVELLMNLNDTQKQRFPMLESILNKNTDYQDETTYSAIAAQITYRKYLLIKNTVAFLMMLTFIFSLMTFSLSYHFNKESSFINIFLMIVVSFMKIMTVVIYYFSLEAYGKYLKAIGQISGKSDYLKNVGVFRIVFQSLLLFIHPISLLNNMTSPWNEYYFTGDNEYVSFQRDFNHYLYLIQFIVIFVNIFYTILENTFYAKTRAQRICKMFGFNNDMTFIIKCILSQNGEIFVFCLMVSGMFFFATLINVSEIGYYSATKESDFKDTEEYQAALNGRSVLIFYYNTFWNMLITMTTIGYGDMYVRANLSRIIICFCALYGAVIFPVMVVTITNLFEINRNEKTSINIVKMVEVKEILKEKAAFVIPNILKLKKAKQKKDKKQINYLNNKIAVQIKEFSKYKQIYQNLFSYSDINDITAKLENINAKYNILMKKFFPIVFVPKKNVEENSQIDENESLIKE